MNPADICERCGSALVPHGQDDVMSCCFCASRLDSLHFELEHEESEDFKQTETPRRRGAV